MVYVCVCVNFCKLFVDNLLSGSLLNKFVCNGRYLYLVLRVMVILVLRISYFRNYVYRFFDFWRFFFLYNRFYILYYIEFNIYLL